METWSSRERQMLGIHPWELSWGNGFIVRESHRRAEARGLSPGHSNYGVRKFRRKLTKAKEKATLIFWKLTEERISCI